MGCPPDGGHESYIEFIDKLPLVADPALFGMNQNANMTKDQTASTNLFNALLLTQQGSGGTDMNAGKSKSDDANEKADTEKFKGRRG